MLNIQTWTFHNGTSEVKEGSPLLVNRADQMTVFITGTSTTRTIQFKGSDKVHTEEGCNWYSIPALKMPDYDPIASSTTGNNEAWIVDLTGWVSVNVNITAIDGGTVTVKAKVVNTVG